MLSCHNHRYAKNGSIPRLMLGIRGNNVRPSTLFPNTGSERCVRFQVVVQDFFGGCEPDSIVFADVVQRVPGFHHPRPEPSPRPPAGGLGDTGQRIVDDLPLGIGWNVRKPPGVGLAMTEELPALLHRVLDDLGIGVADLGIERCRGANPALRQHLHDAEYADARPVIPERPRRDIRNLAACARDGLVQREHFDVRAYPHGDMRVVGPFELRTPVDRGVKEGTVAPGFDVGLPPRSGSQLLTNRPD